MATYHRSRTNLRNHLPEIFPSCLSFSHNLSRGVQGVSATSKRLSLGAVHRHRPYVGSGEDESEWVVKMGVSGGEDESDMGGGEGGG